jgi:hypothetical protein
MERFWLRGSFEFDGFATAKFLFRFGQIAVDTNPAGFDKELDARAGYVRKGLCKVLIEPKIGGGRVRSEDADSIFRDIFRFQNGDLRWSRFRDTTSSAILRFDGATPLSLRKHVFRRHA